LRVAFPFLKEPEDAGRPRGFCFLLPSVLRDGKGSMPRPLPLHGTGTRSPIPAVLRDGSRRRPGSGDGSGPSTCAVAQRAKRSGVSGDSTGRSWGVWDRGDRDVQRFWSLFGRSSRWFWGLWSGQASEKVGSVPEASVSHPAASCCSPLAALQDKVSWQEALW